MKQKLFTFLLAMLLMITLMSTAVSAACYPSAKSINENSIYTSLTSKTSEEGTPLFKIYITTEENDTLLLPKIEDYGLKDPYRLDPEKYSCLEKISGITMHDAGVYVAGNSSKDSSLTTTYGEQFFYDGMKTTVLETPDKISEQFYFSLGKINNSTTKENKFHICLKGDISYFLCINNSGKLELLSNKFNIVKATTFTLTQDSNDPTLYTISAKVNNTTYYLKHTNTGLTVSTTETKYHIYADTQSIYDAFCLTDNNTDINTGKSPNTYVVVKKNSQVYLPEPISYTNFVCWTRNDNGYSDSYKMPFRDFTLPLTPEEMNHEVYNYVENFGTDVNDYSPGYDSNLDLEKYESVYAGKTFYTCYQYDLTCTATNLGNNDRLNVRVGNKDYNSYYNADILSDGKGKITTGNWICVSVPSVNASGYNYTIKNVTFKDSKGNTVATPAEYKKATLHSGAEYIYFKMPNNDLKVELDLDRTAKQPDPTSYAYLINEYGKYTDTASMAMSEKLTMMVQTYYVDADGLKPLHIEVFEDWRNQERNKNFDTDKDKTTYSITDCKWYIRQGETGEYRLLTDGEYSVKKPGGDKQEIEVTLPEKEGYNTFYYQCRYKVQCDQTGEKTQELTKDLTVNVSGISYCMRNQTKNIEKDAVLIENRLKDKNGGEIKLNTFEVSKDNGKTWTAFSNTSRNYYYDDAYTNPDPDYINIPFSVAIMGYSDASFCYYNVTENGTYTFRVTDEKNRQITFTVTYNNLHKHMWSDNYRTTDSYHWRTCTAEGCNAIQDNAHHSFTDNICTACGYSNADLVAAKTAMEKIDALPEIITAKDKDAIIAARSAYNLLTDEQKAKVTNLAKLEAAEKAWQELKKDLSAADKVIAKIDALPSTIHFYDKDIIDAAREAFNALSDSQKALVTNLEKLEAAEKAYEEIIKMPFTDVSENQWYYEAVKYAYQHSLFNGIDNTTFGPQIEMNRAMLVTVLYRLEGTPEVEKNAEFTDVAENQYYAKAVSWAAANGIVYGISETEFAPNSNITREQIATMIMRYAKYKDIDVSAQTDLSGYKDSDKISSWAKEAMSWANAVGLIKGRSETTLDPTATATRAEVAQILMRFVEDQTK